LENDVWDFAIFVAVAVAVTSLVGGASDRQNILFHLYLFQPDAEE
jgi:hypothetical protein